MSHSLGHEVKTLRLAEAVVRLAENLAGRYNVTVPQLIEALLLDYADREMQGEAPPAPAVAQPQGKEGRVIDISAARRRKRWQDVTRFHETP